MSEQSSETYRIIVADGEVLVRNALADYLRGCGYRVIEAATADEVLEAIYDSGEPIGAVLADANLAGSINAFELRLRVQQKSAATHVLLAGNVDAAAKVAGQLCDKGPELRRPYDPSAIVDYIKRLRSQVSGD